MGIRLFSSFPEAQSFAKEILLRTGRTPVVKPLGNAFQVSGIDVEEEPLGTSDSTVVISNESDADTASMVLPRLSDAIAQIKQEATERWWGFSSGFGWIVLDWPTNRGKEFRTFRCLKNSEAVTIPIEEWGPPNFLYVAEVLSKASSQSQLKLLTDFWTSRTRFLRAESEREALEDDEILKKGNFVLKAHKRFIKHLGNVQFLGARRSDGKYSYESHCYKCHQPVDGAINYQCVCCGWLICPRSDCGACGCGHVVKRM